MKTQLNEIKRMQQLAGLINENQINSPINEVEPIKRVKKKSTFDSKSLNENNTPIDYEKLKQILLLACNTYPEGESGYGDVEPLFEKSEVKSTIKYIMNLEKGVKKGDEDIFDKLEDQGSETFTGSVYLDDTQKAKWDGIDLALNVISDVAYEYDLDEAASALNDLAQEINSFQL